MNGKDRAKMFARKLLRISVDRDGLVNVERVSAVIKVLPRRSDTLVILNEYLSVIDREIRKQTLAISSPTELDNYAVENLRRHFERAIGRRFAVRTVLDDSLIAGIRVQAGDRIFEKSIAGTLGMLLSDA